MGGWALRTAHACGCGNFDLSLPADGTPLTVWVGGAFPDASRRFGDVSMEVRDPATGRLLARHPTMVRIRKNADRLSTVERSRFLRAMATLNGAGNGRFRDFRDMHVAGPPDREAHGGAGFLPWHRIYLLDLERELQAIDGEVALPYWRFDQAAPNVFTRQFMGISGPRTGSSSRRPTPCEGGSRATCPVSSEAPVSDRRRSRRALRTADSRAGRFARAPISPRSRRCRAIRTVALTWRISAG